MKCKLLYLVKVQMLQYVKSRILYLGEMREGKKFQQGRGSRKLCPGVESRKDRFFSWQGDLEGTPRLGGNSLCWIDGEGETVSVCGKEPLSISRDKGEARLYWTMTSNNSNLNGIRNMGKGGRNP